MGRFPNIAAAKAKTGAARGKLYGTYAKEIYLAAKNGGVTPEGNPSLKRLIEKAKKEQVPSDVIKRAIEKVTSGAPENYEVLTYEIFGPNGSNMLVECLTDNVNRSVSEVRAVINKSHLKMGAMGSVTYMYDNLSIVGIKDMSIDDAMEALISADVQFIDIENDNDVTIIYGNPNDINKIKDAITNYKKDVSFEIDEVTNLPKEKVKLDGEELELFKRALTLFDEVDDVANVYHNVEL